jgi:Na+-transporting NADH:ubiquinone oxidoreductase subunit C
VVKGGARENDPHGVDAISGGTITSKGLENMIFDCLIKYNNYFKKTVSEI